MGVVVNPKSSADKKFQKPLATKPDSDSGYFTLGVVAPFIFYALVIYLPMLFPGLTDVGSGLSWLNYPTLLFASPFFLFGVFLVLFLWGKQAKDVKMWSFGKGGLATYLIVAISILLLYGSCTLMTGGFGK